MRPVTLAHGAAGCLAGILAACFASTAPAPSTSPASSSKPTAATEPTAPRDLADGAYSCTIDQYDPFPCRVSTDPDGRKRLEKLAGSQRFAGIATRTARGFDFQGTYYCPYGDCTEPVTGQFTAFDDGLYRGRIAMANGQTTITVQSAALGSAAFGYGGGMYGYGGYGYGAR